ncbi:MAG: hypothetical protein IT440_04560 [Phycisphaeraceae bacterium]|nr:hypothetical protein [Phycisphaeraceae bacterium]
MQTEIQRKIDAIGDPAIRAGVEAAVNKTLLTAATEKAYPGHYTVVANGKAYGEENTWPGLDSWQMAGAYLLLGIERLALNYFAFVRGSQRGDGNIPFAIFPVNPEPDRTNYLRGLRWPQDIYTHTPPGRPARKWIGLFTHWQVNANPLSVLAPVSYILTAREIADHTRDGAWLADNWPSIDAAARHISARIADNGLIGGSGFYIENPPRNQWDGITQCYGVKAFRDMAAMAEWLGKSDEQTLWSRQADRLVESFRERFWVGDHFAEYIHFERGLIDAHGLSDVNWGAIAFDIADESQRKTLWPRLTGDPGFWHGGMPTQLVTRPHSYEDWELSEPLPFTLHNPTYDVAAMGRVWWLEACACLRMGDVDRLRRSVKLVCEAGLKLGGWWFERYHAQPDGTVKQAGPEGYCEYAAVLVRLVLGHPDLFA